MDETRLSAWTRRCLQRDGWYPGRKCDAAQLELLHSRMLVGGGEPPNGAVLEFVADVGGMVLYRPTALERLQSAAWIPLRDRKSLPPRGQNYLRSADFRIEPDYGLPTWEMMADIRRTIGQTYHVGSFTWEGWEAWDLLIDNSMRFYCIDYIWDWRVYLLADSTADFFQQIYRMTPPKLVHLGQVQWTHEID